MILYIIRSKKKLLLFCSVGLIGRIMWKESCYIRKRMSSLLSTEDWKTQNVCLSAPQPTSPKSHIPTAPCLLPALQWAAAQSWGCLLGYGPHFAPNKTKLTTLSLCNFFFKIPVHYNLSSLVCICMICSCYILAGDESNIKDDTHVLVLHQLKIWWGREEKQVWS